MPPWHRSEVSLLLLGVLTKWSVYKEPRGRLLCPPQLATNAVDPPLIPGYSKGEIEVV
jgi:hypothetical protein